MQNKEQYKKGVYELKIRTQNIKEELNKDIENLRKNNRQKFWKFKVPLVKQKTQWKATPTE
jgi:hypothetical protein